MVMVRLRRCSLLALALCCLGCPATTTRQLSIIEINYVPHLGGTGSVDHLGRCFLVAGQSDIRGYGHYIYLVFREGAPYPQRLLAAEAFLARPEAASYRKALPNTPKERFALIVAPVQNPREPATAEALVADYDTTRAAVIVDDLARLGKAVPSVALVAYPEPIEHGMRIDANRLLVSDACGDARQVHIKFRRLRDALVLDEREGAVLRLAAVVGRLLTTGSTLSSCP